MPSVTLPLPLKWRTTIVSFAIFVLLLSQGNAVDAPSPDLQAKATNADDHAIFCSYNLKNWLLMDRTFGGKGGPLTSKPEKEKEAVVKTLAAIHPDILGVCEIGSDEDLKDLQLRLAKVGVDLPHSERSHGGDPVRSLGLLSRYPIASRQSQTDLSYMIGEQRFPVQRGFLDVTISVTPQLALRCVGVHLKSKRDVPEADQALMRRNEAHLLREHLDNILTKEPSSKVLLYGDFNETRQEAPISEILGTQAAPEQHMSDILLRDANGEVWTHFWDYQDVYSRFDYFFVSPALRRHVNAGQAMIYTNRDFAKASDHRPIVLRIDFAEKKRSK